MTNIYRQAVMPYKAKISNGLEEIVDRAKEEYKLTFGKAPKVEGLMTGKRAFKMGVRRNIVYALGLGAIVYSLIGLYSCFENGRGEEYSKAEGVSMSTFKDRNNNVKLEY